MNAAAVIGAPNAAGLIGDAYLNPSEMKKQSAVAGAQPGRHQPPSQPEVNIVLEPPVAIPDASPQDRKAAQELLAKGLVRAVIFATDECHADRLRQRSSASR